MKRCPLCQKTYDDNTLNFCFDDGEWLTESDDGPATAIMSDSGSRSSPQSGHFDSSGSVAMPRSIAVLPLAHLSSDPDDEYFCDGLAEELLNALSRVDGLKVAARTSSFSYKGKDAKVGEIGSALGVETVLEGSVRKSGDRLRITVQLINTSDGYHLWSERYDREMRHIFDVQDEITLAVVDALKVKLLGDDRSALLKKGTVNSEAFELYIRGRALWSRRRHEDFLKAIEYFEQAITLDPNYALAYSGLADCYTFLAYFEAYAPAEMMPKARAAIERAVELDPELSETHASLAAFHLFFELDGHAGEMELRRAVAINPNSAVAHYWLCSVLAAKGKTSESIDEGRMALQLDPLSPIANSTLARALCIAGQYEEAIELSKRNFEILPDFFFSHWVLGWAYFQTGRLDEAIHHFRESTVKGGGHTLYGYLGAALVKAGLTSEARDLVNELDEQSKQIYISPIASAIIEASLGNMERGLDLLEEAWSIRSIYLMWANFDPIFDVFRQEPRFQTIAARIAKAGLYGRQSLSG